MTSLPQPLNSKRAFLDALFTGVPNAIAVLDRRGCFVDANPGFEALFGFAKPEIVGRPLVDVIVPPEDRELALRLQDRVRNGETVVTEAVRQRKNGEPVTVQVSVVHVEGEEALLFLYTDLTEMRSAEQALRETQSRLAQTVSSSTAVIYALEVRGATFQPTWVSENITRIIGYEVLEALDPSWWVDHLHPEDRAAVLAKLSHLESDGHLVVEYRFRHRDGTYRWIRDESRLQGARAGAGLEVFGAWLDITDRKLAEDAMREARDLAERSARVRAAFLANMSHEIRTPMNAVLGLTELVLGTELTAEQSRSLVLVRSAGESLLTLLNDILDFSKIEAERMTLESTPFDLRYLLETTLNLLAARTVDRPIELVADIGADVPQYVRGDPGRLRQVLTNLLGNAIKFTHEGEVVLSARRLQRPTDHGLLRLAVRDTGIGIPAAELDLIFDEFTQADASMTRKYGGTGLGLTIARRLVALMGGELTVASVEGRGSEFAFILPLPAEAGRPIRHGSPERLVGKRILVVDDNSTNCRIVREMLALAGASVQETASAAGGFAALRAATADHAAFDLAIIDAQMPECDGFELAAMIGRDVTLTGIRLLMLTSAGRRGDVDRCREVGIQGYLTKPVSRNDLLEAAATMLGDQPLTHDRLVTRHSIAEVRRRLRILLVEDNAVNQEVAATMLRRRGHSVVIASNGREAVEEVARQSYDLVLMDIEMPEMDGYAATQAIRDGPMGERLPIVALTAHALPGQRQRCLEHKMNGYIAKPFVPFDLFAAVEQFGDPGDSGSPEPMRPPTHSPPVDLAAFRAAMSEAGAGDAVDGIIRSFVAGIPGHMRVMGAAVQSADSDAIRRAAHALKSAAGAIGASALAGLLEEMERAAAQGSLASAQAGFPRVLAESDAVLHYLRAAAMQEGSNA